jgi:hypothetical protein
MDGLHWVFLDWVEEMPMGRIAEARFGSANSTFVAF